jgi:ribosomal protein S18 acetylase RimI-like enzyme
MTAIALRPVCDADRPFLLELYASTRAAEMAMVPWAPEQKRAFLEMQFTAQLNGYAHTHPDASHELILAEGRPVGRVWVYRSSQQIHILDLTVAPAERNMGVGAEIMRGLFLEADRDGTTLSIYVEDFNPSQRWFEKRGFRVAKQDGFQLLLERPAVGAQESNKPPEAASSGG